MKKTLLLLMEALLLPVAMNAQLLNSNESLLERAPYALKSFTNKMMAPARADLADNQMILGHYDTDDVQTGGYLGMRSFPGVIPIATVLTPEELAMFQGGRIVAFRVGLASSTPVTRVFVAPATDSGLGTFTEWSCNVNSEGWNVIPVDPPYEINLDNNTGLFIGYDYKQTNRNYPISCVTVGETYPTYLYLTYNGTTAWYTVGLESYGNLSLQCIVESDLFPEYMITVKNLTSQNYIPLGDDIEFTFNTKNAGTASNIAAGACTYDVLVDGKLVTTISNPEAFGREFVTISGVLASTEMTSGRHTLTVVVNSLNGEPVENPISVSRDFFLYTDTFDRQMHLIEEFTSNSCTFCPLGTSMFSILLNMRDDIAFVAIHGNQSATDPCNTSECNDLFNYMGSGGWPYAAFDRSVGWEDDKNIAVGIGYDEEYHQMAAEAISGFLDVLAEEAPSFATVHINSTLDPDTRHVVVNVDGDLTSDFFRIMGEDAKLSVFLTEDGLIYSQHNLDDWVDDYEHNHVYRKALGSVFGVDINKVGGNKYSNTFEITIPTDWNTDNMEVVAFISRPLANGATGVYTDMFVNQANKRKLGEFDEPTTLRGDVDGDGLVSISDVTALIDYLLSGDDSIVNLDAADCDLDGVIAISDVTTLIDYLLSDVWPE